MSSEEENNLKDTTMYSDTLKLDFKEYLTILMLALIKPHTLFQTKKDYFNFFKNSLIMSIIVAVLFTLVNIITLIINTCRVTTGGFFTETKTEWVWENLEDIEFVKVIGMYLLIFFGVIFAIAFVYYVACLIVKSETKLPRLIGISSMGIVPCLTSSLILSPILSLIWAPLSYVCIFVGLIYSVIVIYDAMNQEIKLDNNVKYYIHIICLAVLLIIAYLIISGVMDSNSLDLYDLLDL